MDEQKVEIKRSEFVTVIAWVFIALSAITVAVSALQMIMAWMIFPSVAFSTPAAAPGPLPPPGAQFMFSNFRYLALGFFMVALTALAGSIGLLKRINWGRLLIIGLLGLAILWNLVGFGFQLYMFNSFPPIPGEPRLKPFIILVMVFAAVFVVAFSALFAWLIKKLLSAEVAKEFPAGYNKGL